MVQLFDQTDVSIGTTLQHANYAFFAIACLWVYDFALTLNEEAAFILDARWRMPKLIYLTCRYLPFALIFSNIFRILQLELSLKSCTALFAFNIYAGGIVLFSAESIFMMRLRAVTGRRWLITCCNIVLFVVPVAVTLALYNSSSTGTSPPARRFDGSQQCGIVVQSPILKVASCYTTKQSRIVIVAYALLVIGEIEILSFMLYHSWKLYREHGNILPLMRVLVRNNIFYFACGLLFSTTVVVMVVILPASYGDVASALQFVIHGILATRMHRELYNTVHRPEEISIRDMSLPIFFVPTSSEMQPNCRDPSVIYPREH
ncbi:hypothetical protein EDB19DRAFT_2029382 [Suillus lakei]|nr:hypothetical protein EDB19DRAFT_2029382 [Suillus lakei]